MAVRPVKGIPENKLDEIQREMLGYNNKMAPTYFPKVVPVQVDEKWILVIIARTGQQRPYKVPEYVALMMFCEHPEKFFRYTYVQMTLFPEGSVEKPSVSEDFPNITGSVPQMIQATMERFRNIFIRDKVIKIPGQMESVRVANYPYFQILSE